MVLIRTGLAQKSCVISAAPRLGHVARDHTRAPRRRPSRAPNRSGLVHGAERGPDLHLAPVAGPGVTCRTATEPVRSTAAGGRGSSGVGGAVSAIGPVRGSVATDSARLRPVPVEVVTPPMRRGTYGSARRSGRAQILQQPDLVRQHAGQDRTSDRHQVSDLRAGQRVVHGGALPAGAD
jgi:hypothetical protein